MNILTYASPVSVKPHRMWSISLYKGTLSHENFARERRGVLQLLAPEHVQCRRGDSESDQENNVGALIRLLGGSSGKDVNKRLLCEKSGYGWHKLDDTDGWPCILPGCIYYMQLELEGDLIDCGSHEVALCRVVSMVSKDSTNNAADELSYLSTRKLREVGVISEFGRIAETEN